MIADHLKNINLYKNISPAIALGLDYIASLKTDVQLGDYWINDEIKATVMEYYTVAEFEHGYEAHKRNIDIQYCIIGKERIKWSPLISLNNHTPYDEKLDRAFYNKPSQNSFVDTGDGVFAIFFPEDAHGPQGYVSKPELIKKIVIKVPVKLL
jgi:YhcH/YjgK/YiaL family protein